MHRSAVEQYILEVMARAEVARARCSSLLTLDYPSTAPQDFTSTLEAAFSFLEQAVGRLLAAASWDERNEISAEDLSLIRYADRAVCRLAEMLRFVEAASTNRLPREVVPAFEKFANELVPRATIMLRPQWSYNYTFTLSDIRIILTRYLEEFSDLFVSGEPEREVLRNMPRPFHVVAFPQLEQDNILLHCLLGHELGHLLVNDFFDEERVGRFSASVVEEVHSLADDQMKPWVDGAPLLAAQVKVDLANNILKDVIRYWKRALEELLSDVVGAIMFGPAALFSTFEMAWQQGYDVTPSPQNDYYPPWRRRLHVVFDTVGELGSFFPVADSTFKGNDAVQRAATTNLWVEAIADVIKQANPGSTLDRNSHLLLAYRNLDEWLGEGKSFLLENGGLAKKRIRPDSLRTVLPVLIERLEAGIPPNAIESSLDDRSRVRLVHIINAAWYAKLSAVGPLFVENRPASEALRARSRRNRLTIKAIQFADLADEYWQRVKPGRFREESNEPT